MSKNKTENKLSLFNDVSNMKEIFEVTYGITSRILPGASSMVNHPVVCRSIHYSVVRFRSTKLFINRRYTANVTDSLRMFYANVSSVSSSRQNLAMLIINYVRYIIQNYIN